MVRESLAEQSRRTRAKRIALLTSMGYHDPEEREGRLAADTGELTQWAAQGFRFAN